MSIMRLAVCDVHKADGEIRLAKAMYRGEGDRRYHACAKCLKDIRAYGIPVIEVYDDLGNPDTNQLYT